MNETEPKVSCVSVCRPNCGGHKVRAAFDSVISNNARAFISLFSLSDAFRGTVLW